ncbi:MAG: hypothetical protein K9N53_01325 [Candidatus Marinimicrobia bacterium]|nr:hypothetical protein [Candidatus Neomarinimicrobiota bacterium]
MQSNRSRPNGIPSGKDLVIEIPEFDYRILILGKEYLTVYSSLETLSLNGSNNSKNRPGR